MALPLYLKVIVVVLALIVGYMSYYYGPFKGKADNPVEKVAEEVIKEESGITIDLTPTDSSTPDDKQNNAS